MSDDALYNEAKGPPGPHSRYTNLRWPPDQREQGEPLLVDDDLPVWPIIEKVVDVPVGLVGRRSHGGTIHVAMAEYHQSALCGKATPYPYGGEPGRPCPACAPRLSRWRRLGR